MKIVYVICSLAQEAGLERVIIDKMNYLASMPQYELYLITYEQGDHPISFPLSNRIKHIAIQTKFHPLYKLGMMKRISHVLTMKRKFARLIKQHVAAIRPDIIIGITQPDITIDTLVNLRSDAKIIIESHVERFSLKKEEPKTNALKKFISRLYKGYIARQFNKADAFVVLTEQDARAWKEIEKKRVIPNVLTHYPAQIAYQAQSKRVISAGRLEPQKGYDLLIKAWKIVHANYPEWKLDIYGAGSQQKELLLEAQKLGLESSFTLHPSTAHIYNNYQESALYVMSSRFEGFGLVLIEAMACGLPSVSFDCPHGPSEILKEGEDGLLVENGNIEQLAEKIAYLIEHEQVRQEMSAKARENVKRYLPQNIMPQWEALFESLTKKQKI